LPLNISDYFRKRLPKKKTWLLPELVDFESFDKLLTGSAKELTNLMARYSDDYLIDLMGCVVPNQKWFKTFYCMDMLYVRCIDVPVLDFPL
jgi:hypothetical protein